MIKPTTKKCLLLFSVCLLVSSTFNSSLHTFNHVLTCLIIMTFSRRVSRNSPKSESLFFFFLLSNFLGGGAAQKIAEKMIFSTKKVAKYR